MILQIFAQLVSCTCPSADETCSVDMQNDNEIAFEIIVVRSDVISRFHIIHCCTVIPVSGGGLNL